MISETEKALVQDSIALALEKGAEHVRITFNRNTEDLIGTLNGEVDKITRCEDRSMSITLFVDGRYGAFSTNKLDKASLGDFIADAIATVRMFAPDPLRRLPDPALTCKDALRGDELGLCDPAHEGMTPARRRETALKACIFPGTAGDPRYTMISEEGEYSDSAFDSYMADSDGLSCCHSETSFDYWVEITIEDPEGMKYSGSWWDSSTRLEGFDPASCARKALAQAIAQIGALPAPGGKYSMVISSEVASRLVSPLLSSMSGYSIQQGNSFLTGKLGEKVFGEGLTIMDLPHIKGESGSRLFDSEGLATREAPLIEGGVVKEYFLSTYTAGKLGMEPTVDNASRPRVMPWPRPGMDREDLMRLCGDGILVTEFNGGNFNPATGDFSYGIAGTLFHDGKAVRPVDGMLITGNFVSLWNNFVAAADDARRCMSKLIPTLAFSNVDFSG